MLGSPNLVSTAWRSQSGDKNDPLSDYQGYKNIYISDPKFENYYINHVSVPNPVVDAMDSAIAGEGTHAQESVNYFRTIDIKIVQDRNVDNARFNAGQVITVNCEVTLPNISEENTEVQVYFGQFLDNGTVKNMDVYSMKKIAENKDNNTYDYEAEIDLKTGGNFGYTFRVVPKHEMLLEPANLNLVKWVTK